MSNTTQPNVIRIGWLIGAVVAVGMPHMAYIAPWITTLLLVICAWRLVAEHRQWALPSRWIRLPLVFIGFAGVLFTYRRISGVEAGSALLLVMVALKLLETRTARDQSIVALICLFLVFAAFLREQSIWSIVYLLTGVTFTLSALLQAGISGPPFPITRTITQTVTLIAQSLPLMLLLFFLFPRVPGPFWALPAGGGSGITGLGDTVSPGDITSLGRSDAVAFRVRFDGAVPPPRARYWRGPVMHYFNGRTWSWHDRGYRPETADRLPLDGATVDYEITLEPHGRRWLLALETPVSWDAPRGYLGAGFQLMNRTPVKQRIAYRAQSNASGQVSTEEQDQYLQAMMFLPPRSNPQTVALARRLRGEAGNEQDYLDDVLRMFRRDPFFYTLSPAGLGNDPVDEFLFQTREGFCEHYASAFAVLARAAGIPARVVTGYQGAEKNPLADYWIVRQSNAHAWTEIWLDGTWVRYDPTAAVAPERIEYSLEEALPFDERGVVGGLRVNPVLNRIVLSWDAVNAAWNQWVLGFGPETQRSLLEKLGWVKPALMDLVVAMAAACALFLGGLATVLRRSGKRPIDPVLKQYQRFCRRLGHIGRPREAIEGPTDYARDMSAFRPDLAGEIHAINALYTQLRYDGVGVAERLAEFTERVRRFRPRRRH